MIYEPDPDRPDIDDVEDTRPIDEQVRQIEKDAMIELVGHTLLYLWGELPPEYEADLEERLRYFTDES